RGRSASSCLPLYPGGTGLKGAVARTGIGPGTAGAEGEVTLRPPDPVRPVFVEREPPDLEPGLVSGQLLERPVQDPVLQIMGDRAMRVVREDQLALQRPSPYLLLDPLAGPDALRHGDEDHRTDRPERSCPAQSHREGPLPLRDQPQMLLD